MTVLSRLVTCVRVSPWLPKCVSRYQPHCKQFQTWRSPMKTRETQGFGLSKERGSGFRANGLEKRSEGKRKTQPQAEKREPGDSSKEEAAQMFKKSFVYTVVAVPLMFAGCMIWQYERIRSKAENMFIQKPPADPKSFRQHMRHLWHHSLSPGRQLVLSLVAVNTVVFFLWKIPRLTSFMFKYFTCIPLKGQSIFSTTLSGFSHKSFLHLFVNMYVLESFCNPCSQSLGGKEQTFAVFLGGATFAGLFGNLAKTMLKSMMIPSVGASGGILALIALMCTSYPDARLNIAFVEKIIPHSFSGQSALIAIMAIDTLGLFMGWKVLDHAGHLGGALFGVWYAYYGKDLWKKYQKPIVKRWHEFRSK